MLLPPEVKVQIVVLFSASSAHYLERRDRCNRYLTDNLALCANTKFVNGMDVDNTELILSQVHNEIFLGAPAKCVNLLEFAIRLG